jgi:hypothetical protein
MFKAPRDISFACSCGQIKGTLRGAAPSTGTHLECFCTDCRAAEVYAGQPDIPSVTLFQTSADKFDVEQGHDKLAVFSFGEKNLLRWHAACCGSIMFNTLRNPKTGFASIRVPLLADQNAIGKVTTKAFIKTASGKSKHHGMARFVYGLLARMAAVRLSGRWKQTPFFDTASLKPVREVQIVSKEDRAKITASLT